MIAPAFFIFTAPAERYRSVQTVPRNRIQPLNQEPVNRSGKFVLYWMIANRRPVWNFSLDRSLEWAKELHTPAFFLARMVDSAARQIAIRMERVDSNGLLPMRLADRVYPSAYSFRRYLQKKLPEHLSERPRPQPLTRLDIPRMRSLPKKVSARWEPADLQHFDKESAVLGRLPIDHGVRPVSVHGGAKAAQATLKRFLNTRLAGYAENRNHPDEDGTSGLSPYLHFGHISPHEVVASLMKLENWSLSRLQKRSTGSRTGWWGMSTSAESFMDELITWRELGFNMAWQKSNYEDYKSLPTWSLSTLAKHAKDPRPYLYGLEELETACTHDTLWNAAQRQLTREGRIHNYLRMLWGKKILEWSSSPQQALSVMTELNNKYALDGRDPNSTSGFFWVLGRYDRAWGPERPVFGTVRYMSSANTARKLRLRKYLERYAAATNETTFA
jgi:deoxyribodipyrimidine photo-lyase